MFTIEHEGPEHWADIEYLHDLSFGPGRFAKTAYRLREGVAPLPELSFVAWMKNGGTRRMVGSVRFSPIRIGEMPALLLGPLAVDPKVRGKGAGLELMARGLDEARKYRHRLVILVGDAPYYGKAGFIQVPPGQIRLPGPVDPTRLLACELVPGALMDATGDARGGS